MAGLLGSLKNATDALLVFQRALDVTQNNVMNVSTPGYAKQSLQVLSQPFTPDGIFQGGVRSGPTISSRSSYADNAVEVAIHSSSKWQQMASSLGSINGSFDITGTSGVPGALNSLTTAFSAWSNSPNDTAARQDVLAHADETAQAFQQASAGLHQQSILIDHQIGQTVDSINGLASRIRDLNELTIRNGGDAGAEANIQAAVEEMSKLVNVTTSKAGDGTTTVLLDGQVPLVMSKTQFSLSASARTATDPPPTYPMAPAALVVEDSNGKDLGDRVQGGQLSALMTVRNKVIPSLIGDAYQQGDLNRLAQSFADRVNSLLTSGQSSAGPPPVSGVALFTYDAANPTSAAASLAVNPSITPSQLAAIDPGPPAADNGTALRLANLSSPSDDSDKVDGVSFAQFYGQIASRVGSSLATAQANSSAQQDALTQAQNQRQQISGVDLNEEAVKVLEFQRSYEAAAKMVTVLDQMMQTVVNMITT